MPSEWQRLVGEAVPGPGVVTDDRNIELGRRDHTADEHTQPQCVPLKKLMIGFHPPVWAVRNDPPFCRVGRDRWSAGQARHRPQTAAAHERSTSTCSSAKRGRGRQIGKRSKIRSQNYRSAANSRGSGSCGCLGIPYRISARGAIFGREPALAGSDTGTRPPTAIAAGRTGRSER